MLIVVTIVYIILLILLALSSHTRYYLYAKSAASFCFVAIAICGGIASDTMPAILSALPSLFLFAIGDMVLALKYKNSVLHGLLAFIFGDLGFLLFYHRYMPFYGRMFIFPMATLTIYTIIDYLKIFDLKRLNLIAGIYVFTISLLVSMSVLAMQAKPTLFFTMMSIGMILYFISDIFLAVYKFKNHFILFGFLCLLFYYLGLYLIAASFFFM